MHMMLTALAVVGTLGLVTAVRAEPITIDQALDRASRRPSIQMAALDIEAARARSRGAALPLYNPELSGGGGPQFGAGAPLPQFQVGLSQTIELGGKRDARVQVADSLARGAEISERGELLRARVETWRAFERALVLRDRLETRREVEKLALSLATAMQKSASAGGATKLRVNLVVADAGRATQERVTSEAEYASARTALALAIGAGANEQLEPVGDGADLPALSTSSDELVARAFREHPAAIASDNGVAVATARIADADARGRPDVTLGLSYEYVPDPEGPHAVLGTLVIPIPLRNRNQGERAAARIDAHRTEIERAYVRVEIDQNVRLAVENYQRAREAVAGFDRGVMEKLNENLAAAQDAFANGGLDFVELVTIQRDLIASRLAFLDARLALVDAWAQLALVSGMEVKS